MWVKYINDIGDLVYFYVSERRVLEDDERSGEDIHLHFHEWAIAKAEQERVRLILTPIDKSYHQAVTDFH